MWAWIEEDPWRSVAILYVVAALLSFFPVVRAILRPVKLAPGGESFDESPHFSEKNRQRLKAHYSRIQGTLGFWKTHAAKHGRFHLYTLFWTILASVTIPLMAQAAGAARWPLTIISLHTALMLGIHRGFKVEMNYRAFRSGESEFYDLYRRLLDQPHLFGVTQEQQIQHYFREVEMLRKIVRMAETDNLPSVESTSIKQRSPTAPDQAETIVPDQGEVLK